MCKNLKNWSDAAFGIQQTLGTSMDLCPSQRFGPPLAMDEFLSHNGSKPPTSSNVNSSSFSGHFDDLQPNPMLQPWDLRLLRVINGRLNRIENLNQ